MSPHYRLIRYDRNLALVGLWSLLPLNWRMWEALSYRCPVLRSTVEAELMHESDFGRLLLDSVDEALADVFSAEFREMFYRYLEVRFCIMKATLPSRVDDLASVLSTTFGPTGSLVLERAIAKRLYSRVGIRFIEKPGWTLVEYFDYVKKKEDVGGRSDWSG